MSGTSPRAEPRITAIANQKGGVGKTTTAINLAAGLARLGQDVILLDLDPQGNASTGLGIPTGERQASAFDLLSGERRLTEVLLPTGTTNLRLVPATKDLASLERVLAQDRDRLTRLRRALADTPPGATVIIDCPPALGLLTLNALVAAQGVVIPLQAEFYALEGVSNLLLTLREVRRINPDLRIEGVVLTMHDTRNNLSQQVEADARENLGEIVFRTVIPRNVRLSEAPSHGRSIFDYDAASRGGLAYRALAAEYLSRHTDRGSAHVQPAQ